MGRLLLEGRGFITEITVYVFYENMFEYCASICDNLCIKNRNFKKNSFKSVLA